MIVHLKEPVTYLNASGLTFHHHLRSSCRWDSGLKSDRLEKPGIKPATPTCSLQVESLKHCDMEAYTLEKVLITEHK